MREAGPGPSHPDAPPPACRQASWNQRCSQAAYCAPDAAVGTEALQEGSPWHAVQVQPLRWLVSLQGHCPRKDVRANSSRSCVPQEPCARAQKQTQMLAHLDTTLCFFSVVSRPSSPTLPSVSACGLSSSKTARRLLPSCRGTVA
eukprot:scaffold253755_cov33-Tisochrysis_lutea.AAC.2